jgi:hypothetical protein
MREGDYPLVDFSRPHLSTPTKESKSMPPKTLAVHFW